MATKTIGTGGDYSTLALYLVYLQTLGTLAAPEIGQLKNQLHATGGGTIDFSGFTPTSTNTWTLTTEAGASFKDAAPIALRYYPSNYARIEDSVTYASLIDISVPYARISGVLLRNTQTNQRGICIFVSGENFIGTDLIGQIDGGSHSGNCVFGSDSGIGATTPLWRRCVAIINTTGQAYGFYMSLGGEFHGCGVVVPSNLTANASTVAYEGNNYGSAVIKNSYAFNCPAFAVSSGSWSGSTNNATNLSSFPTGISGQSSLTFANVVTQSSNASSALDLTPVAGQGLENNGVQDTTNNNTDIFGTARGNPPDIGPMEVAGGGGGGILKSRGMTGGMVDMTGGMLGKPKGMIVPAYMRNGGRLILPNSMGI